VERKLVPVKLDSYKPLREIVLEALRDAIVSGILEPGERLMEIQLAEEMGVSRTPVREAIRKLELEGFIVMIPRKGAYVAGVSYKDIKDVFEIRAALEGLAAGLAAEKVTDEEIEQLERILHYEKEPDTLDEMVQNDTDFHAFLYKAARNDKLIGILANLRENVQRYRTTSLAVPGRVKYAIQEHREIVDAVARHDVEEARNLAAAHIENAAEVMFKALGEKSSGR